MKINQLLAAFCAFVFFANLAGVAVAAPANNSFSSVTNITPPPNFRAIFSPTLSTWDEVGAMHWQQGTPDGTFSDIPAGRDGCNKNAADNSCFNPVVGVANKTNWDSQYTLLRLKINGDNGGFGGDHHSESISPFPAQASLQNLQRKGLFAKCVDVLSEDDALMKLNKSKSHTRTKQAECLMTKDITDSSYVTIKEKLEEAITLDPENLAAVYLLLMAELEYTKTID